MDKKFNMLLKNGHLDAIKSLWKENQNVIDIHADDEYVFRYSCINGHLDIAQWLWEISNGTINIHDDNIF